ncbi:hypothetical protein KSS87_019055, partial [Heliosperma pusillum]
VTRRISEVAGSKDEDRSGRRIDRGTNKGIKEDKMRAPENGGREQQRWQVA